MKTEEKIKAAMAKIPADFIITGGKIINVYTGEIIGADIAITNNIISRVGKSVEEFKGKNTEIIDASGHYVLPGFIESHIHFESSMLTLTEFAKEVLKHGTTTVVIDPHEITNVLGEKALKFLIREKKDLPLKVLIELPSCVPALKGFETPGAVLDAKKIKKLIKNPDIFALAEMMNYPGVFLGFTDVIAKIDATKEVGKIIEGHAPLLTGKQLQAYVAAGISSDHESSSAKEALEKLRLGMKVQVREGSFAKDLKNIIEGLKKIKKLDYRNLLLASDDRNAVDLKEKGHLDYSIKLLIESRVDPVKAVQMATINTATHLRLEHIIGGLAPGKLADIVIIDNFEEFGIKHVFANGKHIYSEGELLWNFKNPSYPSYVFKTTKKMPIPTKEELMIRIPIAKEKVLCKVIGLKENSLITEKLEMEVPIKDGIVAPDLENDVLPIVVINRHSKKKSIGKALVHGFGLENAAIASTVAHDCHQLICVGTDYDLMLLAVTLLKEVGGGQVLVTHEGYTLLPLPIAGLISIKPINELVDEIKKLHEATSYVSKEIKDPFMALSFIALPVIPHLKVTDRGLIDVDKMEFVEISIK